MNWFGVMPAMTTAFDENLEVDHDFMKRHGQWMIENGCTGLIMLGSLGEAATLALNEKVAILENMATAVGDRVPVVAAISALFHLHVMRNGVFLTGRGRSLADDFRRIPRLVAGFISRPFTLLPSLVARPGRALESDAL